MPSPPCACSPAGGNCVNISSTCASDAAGMPLSVTVMHSPVSSSVQCSPSSPCSSVYSAALDGRLPTTCDKRRGSACSCTGCGGNCRLSRWRRASISGRTVSTAVSMTEASQTSSRRKAIAPRVMRETSSRSSSSAARCCTWRSITSWHQRFCTSVTFGVLQSIAAWRIGASGLRSSCASVARNSSLRRSASRNSCSSHLRSVMSVNHTATSSCSGEAMHCTQPARPSSRRSISNCRARPCSTTSM